jgi:cytochrome c556
MRALGLLLVFLAIAATAQAPSFQPVGSMSQLMIYILYPASDALFYIERTPPKTDVEWNAVRTQALTLAEAGNLLMMPSRVREGEWNKDAKMLVDVSTKAFKAALAKDMDGITALNQELNDACVVCHVQYRPGYGKRRSAQ